MRPLERPDARKTARPLPQPRLATLIRCRPRQSLKRVLSAARWPRREAGLILTAKSDGPRRGEIWRAMTGGKRHTVVIISLDQRNLSERMSSLLAGPFPGYGGKRPTRPAKEASETRPP